MSTRIEHEDLEQKTRISSRHYNTNEARMKHEDLEEILCVDSRKNRPCDLTDRLPYDTLAKLASDTKFIRYKTRIKQDIYTSF